MSWPYVRLWRHAAQQANGADAPLVPYDVGARLIRDRWADNEFWKT